MNHSLAVKCANAIMGSSSRFWVAKNLDIAIHPVETKQKIEELVAMGAADETLEPVICKQRAITAKLFREIADGLENVDG